MEGRAKIPSYQKQLGAWLSQVSDLEIAVPVPHVATLQDIIRRWLATNPHPEATWVQQTYGVPTLCVRFDCSVGPDGELCFYEIEERPQGIGTSREVNPFFAERLAEVQCCWPSFVAVETPAHIARGGSDDGLWLNAPIPLAECPDEGLLLVRSEPHEEEAWQLAARSVSTIRSEGCKRYGVDLGWWREVSDPDELPWEEQFVLKPSQGSKCLAVRIWLGGGKAGRRNGAYTKTKIIEVLRENGTMLCQPYHEPYQLDLDGRRHSLLLRPFFGYVPHTGEWRYLGGEWLIDPSVKLHGTRDTIFGRLV